MYEWNVLEFSKILICQPSSKDWCEKSKETECMIDDGSGVFTVVQLCREVDDQNS